MDKYFTHRHLFDFPVEIDISGEVIELRYVILPNILNALRIMEREKYNPDKTASLVFIFLLTVKIIFIIDWQKYNAAVAEHNRNTIASSELYDKMEELIYWYSRNNHPYPYV